MVERSLCMREARGSIPRYFFFESFVSYKMLVNTDGYKDPLICTLAFGHASTEQLRQRG
jgi:hypothetical protein